MGVTEMIVECKKRAEAQGLSLSIIAERIGVDRSLIGHWWNHRRQPSAANLLALISAVGLKIELHEEGGQVDHIPVDRAAPDLDAAKTETKEQSHVSASKCTKKKRRTRKASSAKAKPSVDILRAARVVGVGLEGLTCEDIDAAVQRKAELGAEGMMVSVYEKAAELRAWLE